MKTPVIIPAFQEECFIGQTLRSLPPEYVEPIVVTNGPTDNTFKIAEQLGARTIQLDEQGKLPAIQIILRELGNQALNPLLILDADTRPIMPRRWHDGMISRLTSNEPDTPSVIGAPIWFYGSQKMSALLHSIHSTPAAALARARRGTGIGQAGPNMGIKIASDTVLDEILALPHYWPGEDRALIHTVQRHGGNYLEPVSLAVTAFTRLPESFPALRERIKLGKADTSDEARAHYLNRAAPGSIPFEL